jgi:hypothetical protein
MILVFVMGFFSNLFLRPTVRSFQTAVRSVQVALFADLLEQYRSEMDEDGAATLAAQVVNYLKGEDIHPMAVSPQAQPSSRIAAIAPEIKCRAAEKMTSDRLTREVIVATLRMKAVLLSAARGSGWFTDPAKERIEQLLRVYGAEFPEAIKPDSYQELATAYHEVKKPFVDRMNNPQMAFGDFLMKHGAVKDGQIAFTDEEKQAIDVGWVEFAASMSSGALPGERLYVRPDVMKPLQEASAVASLDALAQTLVVSTNPAVRGRACVAAAKSLAIDAAPLHIYNMAQIFVQAEDTASASCLYREFLFRHERDARPQSGYISQQAVADAREWLSRVDTFRRR